MQRTNCLCWQYILSNTLRTHESLLLLHFSVEEYLKRQFLHFASSTFPFNTLMKNLLVPGCSHRYQLIGNRNIAASSDINIKLLKERFPHEIESIFLGAEENTTFKAIGHCIVKVERHYAK